MTTQTKALSSIFLIAVFLGLAAVIHLTLVKEKKQEMVEDVKPVSMTLSGTYDCLPFKENAPTENRTCTYGLTTEKGEMYSLDFNLLAEPKGELKAGDKIKAEGTFTPIEMLSSEYLSSRYDVKGIFSVTGKIEVESKESGEVTSNGIISFERPKDFGLAVNKSQILVSSYIPPCDENFDYCLYYNGTQYDNTNFGSAGLRIKKRDDLKTVQSCANTSPLGYERPPSKIATTTAYTLSTFRVGDAAMSHFAHGELYRLFYKNTCHEFETRVSGTSIGVYDPGTKKEFDEDEVKVKVKGVLAEIKLVGGESVVW